MPKKKKIKPPPKYKLLFKPIQTTGWGDLTKDPGASTNAASTFLTEPSQSQEELPSVAPPAQPSYRGRSRPCFCTLVLRVPPRLEYIARGECSTIWKKNTASYSGMHQVRQPVKHQSDVRLAEELRSPLALSVLAKDHEDFFAVDNEAAMLSRVTDAAQWLPWTNVMRTWAMLSEAGRRYDANVDVVDWFPPPSFYVRCKMPNGCEITNYDYIVDAFIRGMMQQFPNWAVDTHRPLVEIILEIDDPSLSVLVLLKTCAVRGPFQSPNSEPVTDAAVAYTLLKMAEVKSNDVVVNCSCATVDVIQEMLETKAYGSVLAIACDVAVTKCLTAASQWGGSGAEGICCDTHMMPFRTGSVDVIIAVLSVAPNRRNFNELTTQVKEMERVTRPGTGRVCFLTPSDEVETLLRKRRYWESVSATQTSFDGIACMLYVLRRNTCLFESSHHPPPGFEQRRRLPYDPGRPYEMEMDWTDEI